jgi:Calcineurin-like phosphoesterase
MNDQATLSFVGDWGTGTDEAQEVANCVREFSPDFTVHLGDVYFVGGPAEIKENYLGEKTSPYDPVRWPVGKMGSFALSGNHEMYARGRGYYEEILPRMGLRSRDSEWGAGQWASFFCLENKYWRIIGLDTGYNATRFDWGKLPLFERSKFLRTSSRFKPSCAIPQPALAWLESTVNPVGDNRGLILLTHHGCYSAFSDWYQIPAKQLARIIQRPVLWFWGHEHKLAIYDKYAVPGGIAAYGRCIGHGGMPVERGREPDIECPLLAWDNRRYTNGEKVNVGYNGHVNLSLNGPLLHAEYRDLHRTLLFTEDWRVDLVAGSIEGPNLHRALRDPSVHFGSAQHCDLLGQE